MACEYCRYCRFPRSSTDNGGQCKCKAMKYKTIDVSVEKTPDWCPIQRKKK